MGATTSRSGSRTRTSPAAVVVFGKPDSKEIDLASLAASAGYVIGGPVPRVQLGGFVGQAGDINRDGHDDLIVSSSDAAHLLYGRPPPG
jgi:hypothetical protein